MKSATFSMVILLVLTLLSSNGFSQGRPDGFSLKNKNVINNSASNKQIKMHSVFVKETPSVFKLKAKPKSSGSGFGARLGIGTDISGGIGFGFGAFYILTPYRHSSTSWDLGIDIYIAGVTEEERDSEGTKFEDKTNVFVFALRSNGLFNYYPNKTAVYFIAGAGFVLANVSWEENITYYEPYVPHTERWSDEVFSAGNILNLGVGLTFGSGFEARLETPLLIFYSVPGTGTRSASSIAPTFTLNALYRFP